MLRALEKYSVVLYIGAGSCFVKAALKPAELLHLCRPLEDSISVKDDSDTVVMIGDTESLVVNIGSQTFANRTIKIVKPLGADVIIGYNVCGSHVDAACLGL